MSEKISSITYDGIIILDAQGHIIDLNETAIKLLGIDKSYLGKNYIEIMINNNQKENDEFHQAFLDVLNNKKVEKNKLKYYRNDRTLAIFDLRVSSLVDEKNEKKYYLIFSDVSELEKEKKRYHKSIIFLISLLLLSNFWNFLVATWNYSNQAISQSLFSKSLVVFCLILIFFGYKYQILTLQDNGLKIKGKAISIIFDLLMTLVFVFVLIFIKKVMLKYQINFSFYNKDFFVWDKYSLFDHLFYALSVFGQEFLARGVVHETLLRIIPNDAKEYKTIIISSIAFGSIHIHLGLFYMLSSAILLFLCGLIYKKQKTIWGICIPHFVLGQMIGILGFVSF